MRVGDLLYFAPGIRFDEVDLDGSNLPEQFGCRIVGFYIEPSEECACQGHAFAAGVLLVSCIDALARLHFGRGVEKRFGWFLREKLSSFSDRLAERFFDEFRNGLVHECRLKNGAQFSLEMSSTVQEFGGVLIVNPECLAREVRSALQSYLELLERESTERVRLADALRQDLAEDFRLASA